MGDFLVDSFIVDWGQIYLEQEPKQDRTKSRDSPMWLAIVRAKNIIRRLINFQNNNTITLVVARLKSKIKPLYEHLRGTSLTDPYAKGI